MLIRWLTFLALALVLAACAKPPRQDLDATEYLVARAYANQAPAYAAEEYQAAFAALEDGRRMIAERDYAAARTSLAFARQHALRAYALTDMAKAQEAAAAEARRLAEEEARRLAAEEEVRRLAAEEEARRLVEEEARRQAEEETRKANETRMFTSYRVVSGDTLASIAALPNVYGDPLLWPLLYQGNRDQIKDPSKIDIGQLLTIPRGVQASDLELARQKAREAGLFGLPANGAKPPLPRP
jgi:nucleoid-associated protein YgaU